MYIQIAKPLGSLILGLWLSLCVGQIANAAPVNPTESIESQSFMRVDEAVIAAALLQCSPSPAEIAADEKALDLIPPALRCPTRNSYQISNCNGAAQTCRDTPQASRCQEFLRRYSSVTQ